MKDSSMYISVEHEGVRITKRIRNLFCVSQETNGRKYHFWYDPIRKRIDEETIFVPSGINKRANHIKKETAEFRLLTADMIKNCLDGNLFQKYLEIESLNQRDKSVT